MTISIAVTGKSGNGKTTITKAILNALHENYPNKSALLIDNDLSCELGCSFGIDIKNTIYDVKTKKYEYKSRLPEDMSRQEFIEWAIQDIVVNLYDDIDIIASGLVSSEDCRCYIEEKIGDALVKLTDYYDIVILDCEYDLEYLSHLVDRHIDVTLIVAENNEASILTASRIKESSQRFAAPGQIGVVINKTIGGKMTENVSAMLAEYDIDLLGTLPYDDGLSTNPISRDSKIVTEAVNELLFRLNLPQL